MLRGCKTSSRVSPRRLGIHRLEFQSDLRPEPFPTWEAQSYRNFQTTQRSSFAGFIAAFRRLTDAHDPAVCVQRSLLAVAAAYASALLGGLQLI